MTAGSRIARGRSDTAGSSRFRVTSAISTSTRWPSFSGVGSRKAIRTGMTRVSVGLPGSSGRIRRPVTVSAISSTVPFQPFPR